MIKKLSRLYEMMRELKRSVQGGKTED